jgi:hypothetical protein
LLHNHLLLLLELLLLELLELQVLQVLQLLLEQSERVAAAARLHPQPLQLPSRARHSPQPDEGLLSKDASNTGSARMPRTLAQTQRTSRHTPRLALIDKLRLKPRQGQFKDGDGGFRRAYGRMGPFFF